MSKDLALYLSQFAEFTQRKDLGPSKPNDSGYIFLRAAFIASLSDSEITSTIENFRKHVCIGMNCKAFAGNLNRTPEERRSFECRGFTETIQYHPVADRNGHDVTLFTNWTAEPTEKVLKKALCKPKIIK